MKTALKRVSELLLLTAFICYSVTYHHFNINWTPNITATAGFLCLLYSRENNTKTLLFSFVSTVTAGYVLSYTAYIWLLR